MAEIIQIKHKKDGQLTHKWREVEKLLASSDSTVAIKIGPNEELDLFHSPDVDDTTLIGLLELFKGKLIG